MKKWIIIFILSLSFSGFAAEKKFLNVTIQGLTCPYCVSMLIKNLGALEGIDQVRVSDDTKRLLIVMKPNANPDISLITQTINKSGYLALATKETSEKTQDEINNTAKTKGAHVDVKNQPCSSCHNKK